jgi:hypothetical protein
MKNSSLLITLFFFTFITASVLGQSKDYFCIMDTTTLVGTFNGKSIFFQNTPQQGLQKIAVNNHTMTSPYDTFFELDFTKFNIKTGEDFEMKLVSCSNYPKAYTILNPEVVQRNQN